MKYLNLFVAVSIANLVGCASQEVVCENITLASEQIQECQSLQKQINSAKGKPLLRTELERRYQKDCVEVRYYRDDHQAEICGNKNKMLEAEKAIIKKQQEKQ